MSMSTAALSDVFDAARALFTERRLPSSQMTEKDVQGIIEKLDKITVAQVGLAKQAEEERKRTSSLLQNPFKDQTNPSPVTYYHIYECPDFTMGIFCIPENCDIPIHDHPDMTVCSKVLYGKVHVEAYDEAPDLRSALGEGELGALVDQGRALVCRKVRDDVVDATMAPSALFSKSLNIHRFSAVSSCAILDVLGPPYSSSEGREIAYYRERALEEGIVVLEKVAPPSDFSVEGRKYTGEAVA